MDKRRNESFKPELDERWFTHTGVFDKHDEEQRARADGAADADTVFKSFRDTLMKTAKTKRR